MTPPESVAEAFGRYRTRLEGIAARILRDRDEARDVASETFLSMLESGPDDGAATAAWLATSARNRALNRARDRARRARIAARTGEVPHGDAPPSDDRLAALLRAALGTLSERDQEALRMRYVQERGYEDISLALSISPSQARLVVHRASRRLRRQTVLLLARHHGAGEECVKRLTGPSGADPHDGCDPCTAVADEVAAITANGVLPWAVLPALRRLLDLPRHLMRMPRSPAAGRVAEIAVALAMTTVLAAPAAGVVRRGATAGPDVVAATRTVAAVARPGGAVAVASGSNPRRAEETFTDPAGDSASMLSFTHLRMLGVPFSLADALGDHASGGVDLREIRIAAVGRRAAPAGLTFAIGAAGIPTGVTYAVSWAWDDSCTGQITATISSADQTWGSLSIACPERRSGGLLWSTVESVQLAPRVAGRTAIIDVTYRSLGPAARAMLQPGRRLLGVTVTSSDASGPVTSGGDRAPDDGDPPRDYTIGA